MPDTEQLEHYVEEDVTAFSAKMKAVLLANASKGLWHKLSVDWLYLKLLEEVSELEDALVRRISKGNVTVDEIVEEAVDIANVAMMIADNAKKDAHVCNPDELISAAVNG